MNNNKNIVSNIALILAGGIGSRVGETIPKQFVEINGKPLIIYTLEKFDNNSNIDYICIVCHSEWINKLWDSIDKYKIKKVKSIIAGGNTGLSSAYKGIIEINKFGNGDSLVLIHDAVRPFIDEECINANIKIASQKGLAMCAVSLVETLAYSEDSVFSDKVIPRDNLYRIQTPQTFKLSILNNLYSNIDVEKSNEPSTFSLYMKQGLPIYLSPGNEKNIKITYPEDLNYFKQFFK